jgi:hypothetical protein
MSLSTALFQVQQLRTHLQLTSMQLQTPNRTTLHMTSKSGDVSLGADQKIARALMTKMKIYEIGVRTSFTYLGIWTT